MWGCPVNCRAFSSVPGLYPPRDPTRLPSCDNPNSLQTPTCALRGKLPLVENHRFRAVSLAWGPEQFQQSFSIASCVRPQAFSRGFELWPSSQGFPPLGLAVSTASTRPVKALVQGSGPRRWDAGGGEPGSARRGLGFLSSAASAAAMRPGGAAAGPASGLHPLQLELKGRERPSGPKPAPFARRAQRPRAPRCPLPGLGSFSEVEAGPHPFCLTWSQGFFPLHEQLLKEPPLKCDCLGRHRSDCITNYPKLSGV